MRRKDQAAGNVADFALDLLDTMTSNRFLLYDNQRLHFRIAIHTGASSVKQLYIYIIMI